MPTFIEAPLLSVVVPIRDMQNRLNSVKTWLAQAEKFNMEVIFVNDSSVDETLDELNKIVLKNRYRFVKNFDGIFGGPGPARNFGMGKSSGKWIAFWDSDDEPNVPSFFNMIQMAEIEFRDIAVGGWEAKQVSGEWKTSGHVVKTHNPKFLEIVKSPGLWRWAFKLERVKKSTFPDILMGEDLVFLANLNLAPRFQYNKSVYTYIQGNPGQLTSNKKALLDRKKMGNHLIGTFINSEFDLLRAMIRLKIKASSFWHRIRND